MNLVEIWNGTYEVLGIIGTVMGVFGVPSIAVFYNKALKKEIAYSPALAFAYTYFNNYVAPLHAGLAAGRLPGGSEVDRVFIRLPKSLTDVSESRLKALTWELQNRGDALGEIVVETPSGKRTVAVRRRGEEVVAFDVPRILASMEPIIAEYVGAPRVSASDQWEKIERREINLFCDHLRRLIRQHHFERHVRVFSCEVAELTPETDDLDAPPPEGFFGRILFRLRSGLRR